MALKRGTEIATIDVALVAIITQAAEGAEATEIALDTADQISVSIQEETRDAIKLIVKDRLRAQKRQQVTITGNTITLRDNLFNPELVKILQGGEIESAGDPPKIIKYTPPAVDALPEQRGEVFALAAYSAIYDEAGIIQGYEKITYPNCKGVPITLTSEDNVFRVSEYTIDSSPSKGQAPYVIDYVDDLPVVV